MEGLCLLGRPCRGLWAPRGWAAKQGDPEAKKGVVGAFCRIYDIEHAMAAFLPGIYEPVDTMPGRFTFTGGSTTGGAVLYDNGKFLYSHHATDPCGGRLVNAFDLVRIHRFGDLDNEAAPGTPVNRLPSYAAMCETATQDKEVSGLLLKERWEEATEGFTAAQDGEPGADGEPEDTAWMNLLKVSAKTGVPQSTIDNVWLILEHDPRLRGKFALNAFAGRGEILGPLPWAEQAGRRLWSDTDSAGLYWYLEKYYQITGTAKIDGALSLHSEKHAFNEITAYLGGLEWDGVPPAGRPSHRLSGGGGCPIYPGRDPESQFTAAVAQQPRRGPSSTTAPYSRGPKDRQEHPAG